jgi:LuxR family maltose regulon positive regulatory protein
LRAHGQLVELRARDLQFSADEAAILFNEVGSLNLDSKQVEAVNQRAEGWIVGLNLAALSLKGQSMSEAVIERFTGSNKFILDYLTEEFVEALPKEHRQFLLRTSILDRFCAPLCAVVTGNPDSQQVLDEFHSESLFLIPLDASGTWFRYHHLFAEVLYALLARDHPGEIDALHKKAADWFEREAYPDEAVDHAIYSGDMDLTRELVLKHWVSVLHRGEVATLLRWLDALPDELHADDPYIPLARCWALFLSGQIPAITPYLERAENTYERLLNKGNFDGVQLSLIDSHLLMIRSVLARAQGEHAMSVAHAEEATSLVPEEMTETVGTPWNILATARSGAGDFNGAIRAYQRGVERAHAEGNLVVLYGGIYGQVMYMMIQGQLNQAEELCLQAINRAVRDGHGDFPATGWLQIAMARINLERYRLEEAEAYLNSGVHIARPGGFGEAVRTGRYLRAHLAAERGDLDTAVQVFQDTARIVDAMHDPYQTGELNREWAKVYINAGDLDSAQEKLAILEEMCEVTKHAHLQLGRMWMTPRLMCAGERYQEALNSLDESIHRARDLNWSVELMRLLGLQAAVFDALGEHASAKAVLPEAIAIGAPGGYIWRWLDVGPGIEPLLRDLRDDSGTPQSFLPYLDSLLDACQAALGAQVQPQLEGRLDPLTPRELEILRLICQGYSNPEIASELVVTLNTIKKHTSNIYGKLGVSSRTQAIGRAHELNLL